MKCDMVVQTEVTLQYIRYVSDLGPHIKVASGGFEKIGFMLFRLSEENQIWVTFEVEWATFACSVKVALDTPTVERLSIKYNEDQR